MLQNHYNWLRWEQDGRRYVIDTDEIAGMEFALPTSDLPATTYILLASGVGFTMRRELAEAFADWYWRTKTEGGYRVPDLDLP